MGGTTSQGTTIGISTLPATDYTDINCTIAINMEDAEAATIDVTCLNSTAKEKILGLVDSGSLTLDLNIDFDDMGYAIMRAARVTGSKHAFEITLPLRGSETTGRKFNFNGYVKTVPFAIAVDSAITGNASVEITGDVIETPPVVP